MSTLSFVSYKKVTSHDTRFCNTKLTSAFSIAFDKKTFFFLQGGSNGGGGGGENLG